MRGEHLEFSAVATVKAKAEFTDFYKILQVDPEADPDVIEAAYKRLARKYHPDLNKSPDANQRMKEINLAYEVLGDEGSRLEYHEEWRGVYGESHSSRLNLSADWLSGARPTVTLSPEEVRFENVQRGQAMQADVTMSLSRRGRFRGEMRPQQAWLKATVVSHRKDAVVIRVTADTSSLRGGVSYEGSVAIQSVLYKTVLIPVRVSVAPEPRPILRVEPNWLEAGVMHRTDAPAVLEMRVCNGGDGHLEGDILVKHGWLSVDKDRFNGDETRIAVTLNPSTLKPGRSYTGKLEVLSTGGLTTVPVKVSIEAELPDLPPPESDDYWPAVLSLLVPKTSWEKDFVSRTKMLCKLRGWKPSREQQSTILNLLNKALEEGNLSSKE